MLSMIIVIILIIGFIVGLNRGFIMEILHLFGSIIAFILAALYYDDLASRITLWIPYPDFGDNPALQIFFDVINAEAAYYKGIAFVLIFIITKILLQILANMLDFLARIPVIRQLNVWAGGILGFIEVYLIIFILLYIGALLPIDSIQTAIEGSILAKGIIEKTPIVSGQIKELWLK